MVGTKSYLGTALLSLLALNSPGVLAHRWFNWQEDISCDATGYFVPDDEADLVSFVKEQYPRKTFLKPVGNGHGFGNLTTCINDGETSRESYILSLTNLKHMQIHKNNNTVTFGAGWDLIDLIPALRDEGLEVHNLGSEMVQNYIGAVTTGTHGTGKQNQNLATQILGLRVLDAQGNIHSMDKSTSPDLIKAFSIGIGALGIVVEATIQVEPTSYLKRTTRVIQGSSNITELYQQIAAIGDQYEQINILGPTLDWSVEQQALVLKPNLTVVSWEPSNYSAVQNCSLDFCANDCGPCDRDSVCYDYKNFAVATPPQGICYRGFMGQFEHFLPIENLAAAGEDYLHHAQSQAARMIPFQNPDIAADKSKGYLSDDVTVITRFIKADDNWLSPVNDYNLPAGSQGVFASLEYSWIPTYNNWTQQYFYQELASEFIPRFGEKYNVRPHWNKMQFHNETYTATIFPKMNEWLDLQEEMDPQCQFINEFLIHALGIDRCQSALT
ncbi:FAD/FMN-containing dehydrogenase [Aspergillus japonicus CBS 114.51]|uniref:D-arabinono-1,4-lactone oxidase n=1 Tax=Aspergillus japonicus CBS 114.51 TaxID=1448312 RepID=A0A8T8WUW8_ASPJA|nr:FAD/FMN-containing dehydrogenase [Aspergillus japonicus CBS 114.51]RAH79625.1 FAD/FMN-containing dehydrogenase [Aspergillus japonicus CBS 114.51]